MTLSWVTLQGHFTELLKSHRQKRNEVQPENEVSVTPVSVQTAMSSSGSGRKEVTSCSHKVFSSRHTCLRLFCYPPSVSHHRDIVSFFSASHICFVQNAECIVRVHRPTHYRRRDVTCTAFTCVFAYLQPFCQLKRKEFCNLLWFHVKSAIYLRL